MTSLLLSLSHNLLGMITRLVKLSIQSERLEEFHELFEINKKSIRNFDGCKHLEVLGGLENEVVFTFSRWQSENHLNQYRKSELFGRIWPKVKEMMNAKPEAWTLQSQLVD